MIKLKRANIILAILLGCILSNCSPTGKPVQIKETYGQQESWAVDYLNENILSCRLTADSIKFKTTPKLGIGRWGQTWEQDFVLGKEDEFILAPDHHLKVSFRIASFDTSGVLLKYLYQFDHRSFGKELITKDEGEIRFNFK